MAIITPNFGSAGPIRRNRFGTGQRGFSLIEVVLVIIILGAIVGVSAQFMGTSFQLYFTSRDNLNVDAQARAALERMTRELRGVRPATGLTMTPATQITFTDETGTSVLYILGGGNLLRNAQVLAGGVTGLSFVYLNSAGAVTAIAAQVFYISVQFTVTQGGKNDTYRATISPRNT